MNKKDLNEQEIRTRYITPAIQDAVWLPGQIREEVYITDGQILPRGKVAPRGKRSSPTMCWTVTAFPLRLWRPRTTTARDHFYLDANQSKLLLNLLEAFLHGRLRPLFEG